MLAFVCNKTLYLFMLTYLIVLEGRASRSRSHNSNYMAGGRESFMQLRKGEKSLWTCRPEHDRPLAPNIAVANVGKHVIRLITLLPCCFEDFV